MAGWACKQYGRVTDASRQAANVTEMAKVQMIKDYMQTSFNMHLGLIDTKSMRSKTIYFAHKLMQEVDGTCHHDLLRFFRDEMGLGTDRRLAPGAGTANGRPLADGGYAQVGPATEPIGGCACMQGFHRFIADSPARRCPTCTASR